MFKTNFRYTNKIVNNLIFIAEARTTIINAPLIPKWEVSLRKDALLRSVHSSTSIEGNLLSLEQVSELADGRDIMVRRKDKQEVLNYIEALEKIPDFAKKPIISINDLLKIHKIIIKGTMENPVDEGKFRNRMVFVVNSATGKTIFTPPSPDEVPKLVKEFLDWINSQEVKEINPVIEAGITHYEIVRIHPFIDGNGRTARVMATLILFKRGFDVKRFFALDDYYDHDRHNYYSALNKVDKNTLDLTEWLEYFTEGVMVSINAVKDKIIGLSKDIKKVKERGQISLNERQMRVVEWIMQNGKITIGDVSKMFNITRQAGLKEMKKLIDLKVIKQKGKGRGAHYILI